MYATPLCGGCKHGFLFFSFFPMTDTNQKQLGKTLWGIADQLGGAMDADNYEMAAKMELSKVYPFYGGGLSAVLSRKIPSNHFRGVTKIVGASNPAKPRP